MYSTEYCDFMKYAFKSSNSKDKGKYKDKRQR